MRRWTRTLIGGLLLVAAAVVAGALATRAPGDVACAVGLFIPLLLSLAVEHQRRVDARRVSEGECLACGYSLRGNVSGVCPECGTRAGEGYP